MKKIFLTQGKFALVDNSDYKFLNLYNWHTDGHYALRTITSECKKIYMHIQIMGKKGIDHIDGNGLNNQRKNLRFANQSENSMNRQKTKKQTSSKYKGVTLHSSGKWQLNFKGKYQGLFNSEEKAAETYNILAKKNYRNFAKLNNLNQNLGGVL